MARFISSNPKVATVNIEEDVYVRDEYGVKRRAFIKGDEVPAWIYKTVTTKNEVVGAAVAPEVTEEAPADEDNSVVSVEAPKADAEDAEAEAPAKEEAKSTKGKGK